MSYLLFFLLSTLLATLFSMGGAGAGVALIPLLHFFGIDFNLAKAVGLFTGFTTTFTSSVMNFKRGVLDVKTVLLLALTLFVCAPLGAQLSRYVDTLLVKGLFAIFLFFSATMMLFFKKEPKWHITASWVMALLGSVVGVLAGLLGVGGGNMLLPLLILLGFPPKKVAVAVSFVVPFSALSSFLSYASFVTIDWGLLGACAAGAIVGGTIGNWLMHFKLSQTDVRRVIATILYLLAIKMALTLFSV